MPARDKCNEKSRIFIGHGEKSGERGGEKEQTGTDQRRDETTLGRRRKGCEQRERERNSRKSNPARAVKYSCYSVQRERQRCLGGGEGVRDERSVRFTRRYARNPRLSVTDSFPRV